MNETWPHSPHTQATFSLLEVMNNKFMSSIICCVLCTFVHRFICLSLAWENYWMYRLVLNNNNRHEKQQREFQHNRLTSFWKSMLSLIFFLLISMAREEHDDTVDRVAIFRLKSWISRGGSILASSSRQASPRTTNQRITQARIDQSAYLKARRCLYSSWAIPFLNCERLGYRKN